MMKPSGLQSLALIKSGFSTSAGSVYEFEAELLDGAVQAMSEYKGKVLLIENVATL